MAHENLKQHLVGKPGKDFVTNLTLAVYDFVSKIRRAYGSFDFIHYRIFEEVTVREYTEQKNKWGDEKPEHYRFDCVIFIEPHQSAINQRQTFTVGVELKNSKGDLMGDAKIEHYLGYTDFFFIGVPSNLVADAVGRAKTDDHIGVFDVETGRLCKMPARIHPTVERKYNLLEQIMYSRMFDEDFKNVVSVKVEDVEVIPAPLKPMDDRSPLVLAMDEEEAQEEALREIQKNAQEEVPGEALREARTAAIEADREAARQKEQARREKHDAKVAALREEVKVMNADVPVAVASMLEALPLNAQRIYHAIRRYSGVQAQNIAEILPHQEGVERPSIATVNRCISSLTKAGLIVRDGSRKSGQYVVRKVDCAPINCKVCAKSPLCTQFQHLSD